MKYPTILPNVPKIVLLKKEKNIWYEWWHVRIMSSSNSLANKVKGGLTSSLAQSDQQDYKLPDNYSICQLHNMSINIETAMLPI